MKISSRDYLKKMIIVCTGIAFGLVFLILAISSFEGSHGGTDAIVQAVLAVASAGSLRDSTEKKLTKYRWQVEETPQLLFGETLLKQIEEFEGKAEEVGRECIHI